jgi:hypothetical protein
MRRPAASSVTNHLSCGARTLRAVSTPVSTPSSSQKMLPAVFLWGRQSCLQPAFKPACLPWGGNHAGKPAFWPAYLTVTKPHAH